MEINKALKRIAYPALGLLSTAVLTGFKPPIDTPPSKAGDMELLLGFIILIPFAWAVSKLCDIYNNHRWSK